MGALHFHIGKRYLFALGFCTALGTGLVAAGARTTPLAGIVLIALGGALAAPGFVISSVAAVVMLRHLCTASW